MLEVFAVGGGLPSSGGMPGRGQAKTGLVEKPLGAGRYLALLPGGAKVEVVGPAGLKAGTRVRIVLGEQAPPRGLDSLPEDGPGPEAIQWAAELPLGFGGAGARVRLEVYGEGGKTGPLDGKKRAFYFVVRSTSLRLGEIQWSLYLRDRQVALQVHAPGAGKGQQAFLQTLIGEVEAALRKGGFVLSAPTLVVKRSFKPPAGFRLNVRG